LTPFQNVPFSEVPTDSTCEEKSRLLRKYNVATAGFSETVKELHRRMGTSPKEDYAALTQISSEARVQIGAGTIRP
jgi:hypothetical protein